MKNMKKLWALLLALAMVLSLAACGGTSDGETATDDQTTEDTATDETTETDSDLAYVQDKGSLVVGITYEFNRWVGRHVQDSRLAKILTAPGMWMQNFTTNEPDDSMIECAIRSLELVLPSEKGKDEW